LACNSNLYRIVNLLISHKADLFVQNSDGKTALTIISNNLLMLKLIKKAMSNVLREKFEDYQKRPREHHLIDASLMRKLTDKYIYGDSLKKGSKSLRQQIQS
jgi:ankyrin repeat protein